MYERERERSDELQTAIDRKDALIKFLATRRSRKPKAAEKPVVPVVQQDAIPAAVQWPIEQRAGGDPFLRRHLNTFAQEQLAKGTDPSEIIHRIRFGDDNEDED
jgi:hypothetical protein